MWDRQQTLEKPPCLAVDVYYFRWNNIQDSFQECKSSGILVG